MKVFCIYCEKCTRIEDFSKDIGVIFREVKMTPLVVHIDQKILVSPGLIGIHSSVLR